MFTVAVKAGKHRLKQTVMKLFDIDLANASMRSEGEKKAYIQLSPD